MAPLDGRLCKRLDTHIHTRTHTHTYIYMNIYIYIYIYIYTVGPVSYFFASISFHNNHTKNSWDTVFFEIWHPRSRWWGRSKVKITYHTQYPTDALPFRFISIGPTIPEIWPKQCLTLKNHIWIFHRKFAKITVSNRTSPKANNHDSRNEAAKCCIDRMSGSHFIVQRSKFLLIDAATVTLGQGHGKVIQYILPDLYIFCPQYRETWRERRTRRKRTENIKSPQTGLT